MRSSIAPLHHRSAGGSSSRVPAPAVALVASLAVLLGLAIAVLPPAGIALSIGVAVALSIAIAALAEPVAGIAVALVLAPFAPLENIMLGLPVHSGQAILALALSAWGLKALYQRRTDLPALLSVRDRRLAWSIPLALALFVAAAAASFFAARSFEPWAKESLKWAEALAVCLIVAGDRNPRNRSILIGAILVSAAFQACLGIYQFGLRGEGPDEFAILNDRTFRAYGTFEQPNPYGGYLGLVWPVAAGVALFLWIRAYCVVRIAWSDEQNARLFVHHRVLRNTHHGTRAISLALAATAVAGLSLTALILSWSRGAWLGAAAAGVAMLIAALRRPALTLAILGAAGVLVVGLSSAGLLPSSIQARLTDFTQQFQSFDVRGIGITSDNYAVVERLAHWQAAQNMILDRPYTGVGFGNYEAAYDQYRTYAWPLALGHAHNYLLNIWAETGLFGFLAYLTLWGSAIVVSLRIAWKKTTGNRRRTTDTLHASRFTFAVCLAIGLLGAWVHLSVHNLFDNLYVANTYLLVGVYLGLLEAIRQSPISNLQSPIHEHRNL